MTQGLFFSFCKLTGFTNLCGDSCQVRSAPQNLTQLLKKIEAYWRTEPTLEDTTFAAVPQKHKHRVDRQQFVRGYCGRDVMLPVDMCYYTFRNERSGPSHCSHYISTRFPPTLCTQGHAVCNLWPSGSLPASVIQGSRSCSLQMHSEPTIAIAVGIFHGRCISS